MHMPRSQQRAHYHIRLSCAQLTLKAQNAGKWGTEYTWLLNVVQIKEIILANVSLVSDFTNYSSPCEHVSPKMNKEADAARYFQIYTKFLPPPNTFHVPFKVVLRMRMPKLHSSIHFRASFLFYANSLSHTIQRGLNYRCFKHNMCWSNGSPPGFMDGWIKCANNL